VTTNLGPLAPTLLLGRFVELDEGSPVPPSRVGTSDLIDDIAVASPEETAEPASAERSEMTTDSFVIDEPEAPEELELDEGEDPDMPVGSVGAALSWAFEPEADRVGEPLSFPLVSAPRMVGEELSLALICCSPFRLPPTVPLLSEVAGLSCEEPNPPYCPCNDEPCSPAGLEPGASALCRLDISAGDKLDWFEICCSSFKSPPVAPPLSEVAGLSCEEPIPPYCPRNDGPYSPTELEPGANALCRLDISAGVKLDGFEMSRFCSGAPIALRICWLLSPPLPASGPGFPWLFSELGLVFNASLRAAIWADEHVSGAILGLLEPGDCFSIVFWSSFRLAPSLLSAELISSCRNSC